MRPITGTKKKLIACICCGVVAALLVSAYLSDARAQAMSSREAAIREYGGERAEVCVAKRDIAAGEKIAQGDVELKTWIVGLLPEDAIVDSRDAIGQTAQQNILANEPLTFAKVGSTIHSISVPEGLCAVSVSSQDVQAVGGAIKPGNLVNVYAMGSSVQLVGEDILVLETSNYSANADGSGTAVFGSSAGRASVTWVTLAVTPDSVEQLLAASKSGSLYFALPGSQSSAAAGSASSDASSPAGESAASPSTDDSAASSTAGEGTANPTPDGGSAPEGGE